jgi:poly(A) polymerase
VNLSKSIKNFVKKLIPVHKSTCASLQATIIARSDHPISRKSISKNALNVLYRLNNNGYEGYLVGGCVRDLLLGLRPKDFDVATDAKPEQVKRLFGNCRLIGRRFRLAHVYYGHDVIEVATFRAGPSKESPKHQTSDSGMLLRDNVFGTIDEDAVRRDFTVNALYYRVSDFAIIDFCNAMQDIQNRVLRLIGNPEQRYREDPVRMLRAARFAAKLNFTLHQDTQEPIPRLAHLLSDVPTARVFEECLKIFMSGHGERSAQTLRTLGLFDHLIPASEDYQDKDWALVLEGLRDTDQRIAHHETTSPGYLFAVLLWPMYCEYLETSTSTHLPPLARKHEAMDDVFRDLNATVAVPKRISLMTTAIWELQHRLESVRQHQVQRLLSHPYFRAAFDFLELRSQTQSPELRQTVQWWDSAQHASGEAFNRLCEQLPKQSKRRARKRSKPKNEIER